MAKRGHVSVVELLKRNQGDELSPSAERAILALGTDAVPQLVAAMEDETLLRSDAPRDGVLPHRAARLLGQLGASTAVEALIGVVIRHHDAEGFLPEFLVGRAVWALGEIPDAAEQMLRAVEEHPDLADTLLEPLARIAPAEPRVFDMAVSTLGRDPIAAAFAFEDIGDRRGAAVLEEWVDRHPLSLDPHADRTPFYAVTHAYRTLVGELTASMKAKTHSITIASRELWPKQLSDDECIDAMWREVQAMRSVR